jgi:hypothetical protein
VDSKTKNIVWKGTASNSIYKKNESKAIAKFVDDMFANIRKIANPTDFFGNNRFFKKIRKQIIHTKINTMKTNFFTIITIVTTFMFSSFLPKWMDLSLTE